MENYGENHNNAWRAGKRTPLANAQLGQVQGEEVLSRGDGGPHAALFLRAQEESVGFDAIALTSYAPRNVVAGPGLHCTQQRQVVKSSTRFTTFGSV